MPAVPVRFGVIGCADIALRRVLPAMAAHADIEVTAIASRDAGRAQDVAARFEARPVTGYAALLTDNGVDAVYVPVPTGMHARWAAAALSAGKHVLVEKPVATTPTSTARLLALARDRQLVLRENVMFVHHHQHSVVRRLMAEGAVGEVRGLEASFTIPRLPDGNIRYDRELGGGALWDIGIYPLRVALHLLGEPLEVAGAVLETPPGRRVETSGAVLMRAPNAAVAQVAFGMDHAYLSRYVVFGTAGRITVDRAFTPSPQYEPEIILERPSAAETIRLAADDQVSNTLTDFVTAVRSDPAGLDRTHDHECLAQAHLLAAVSHMAGRRPPAAHSPEREE